MTKTRKRQPRPTQKVWIFVGWILQWILRLIIAVIGVSVVAGTLVAVWRTHTSPPPNPAVINTVDSQRSLPEVPPIPSPELQEQLTKLVPANGSMQVVALELTSGSYVNLGGEQAIASGGIIALPVLVAGLQDLDNRKMQWDELIDRGKITVQRALVDMIKVSDHTATNLLIGRLGGNSALNRRFQEWGLRNTKLNNALPDRDGQNTTSASDLVRLLSLVERGQLLQLRSRDRFWDILARTTENDLLPVGISAEARIFHKSGETNNSIGDTGMVDMPNGKRYLVAVFVKGVQDKESARELIRTCSNTIYTYLVRLGQQAENP